MSRADVWWEEEETEEGAALLSLQAWRGCCLCLRAFVELSLALLYVISSAL